MTSLAVHARCSGPAMLPTASWLMGIATYRFEHERQFAGPSHLPSPVADVRSGRDVKLRESAQERLQSDSHFHAGEVQPQATMDSDPKRCVVAVLPLDED